MSNETIVNLSRPLKTHKGEVTSLTLKEPSARDFINAKVDPFKIKFDGDRVEYIFDNAATLSFLSSMTGHDTMVLDLLSAADFMKLRMQMVNVIAMGVGDRDPSQA